MKHFFRKRSPFLLFLILLFTTVCWLFAVINIFSSSKFTNAADVSTTTSLCSSSKAKIVEQLKDYDSHIRLISAHKEKNYLDLYFYSPKIAKKRPDDSDRIYNLQIAITKDHIYYGSPFINYDF